MTDLRIIKVENKPPISYLDAALKVLEEETTKMGYLDTRHRRELLQYINDLEEENERLKQIVTGLVFNE